jgi:hypothetical protein
VVIVFWLLSSHLAIIVLTLNKFLWLKFWSFTGSPIHPPPLGAFTHPSRRGLPAHRRGCTSWLPAGAAQGAGGLLPPGAMRGGGWGASAPWWRLLQELWAVRVWNPSRPYHKRRFGLLLGRLGRPARLGRRAGRQAAAWSAWQAAWAVFQGPE